MALWRVVVAMRWLGSDGVLIDPQTGAYLYFSAVAEDDLIQLLFGNSGNPIASIELLGVACAFTVWNDLLVDRTAITFVDNEATKCCLIKGYSPQTDMMSICAVCTRAEIAQRSAQYYERVASPSNLGDGPSRFRAPPLLPRWGGATRSFLDGHAALVNLGVMY